MTKRTANLLFLPALALALLFLPAPALLAQGHVHGDGHSMQDHAGGQTAAPSQPAASAPVIVVSRGVVRGVDRAAGTVILDHEPIPSLGWERMTMTFPVEDPALLDGLAEGAEVRFDLKVTGSGAGAAYSVTDLEAQ
ncbi:MAG: copper-binding protein [Deltaproteobacteria bacterium]|jgi:Cu/Ag efflux protein CusF|nr:copper-binding protein [Deltaproteobacteria bacterium]